MSQKKLATVITAAILGFAAAPAFADAPSEIRSVSVDTSGIDLTTEAGTDVMLAKLRRAAEKACDQRTGPMSLSERSAYQSCYNDAMSAALDSLTTATERQADLKAKQNG
ncbi:UrcA family protein [Henriciella litoralis]|uniref:UrcA family protein n=1 Tax=Henriciella litoralis TaxID=568102 RepID=UPI001469E273|nr:UrcA family protein [Henriciella litoralis]